MPEIVTGGAAQNVIPTNSHKIMMEASVSSLSPDIRFYWVWQITETEFGCEYSCREHEDRVSSKRRG